MKKNRFFLAAVYLLITFGVYSQDWSGYRVGELYPGYVLKADGTKIEGYIEAQSRGAITSTFSLNSNQTRVIFFSDPKNKKTKVTYKPEDLKEYKIAEKVYRSMNYSGGLTSKPTRFALLVEDGHIARYVWYEEDESNRLKLQWTETVIFQKGNEKPFEMSTFLLGFTKKMSNLVADYKELADKVNNKEKGYGALSIYEIIKEYNTWYETQESPQE